MARISLFICDLCKSTIKSDDNYVITLSGQYVTADTYEICKACYDVLLARASEEYSLDSGQQSHLNKIFVVPAAEPIKTNRSSKTTDAEYDYEVKIPSRLGEIEKTEEATCSHDRRSYDHDAGGAICIKCGDISK